VLAYEYGALPPAVTNVKGTVTSIRPTTRPAEMPGAAESDVVLTMGPQEMVSLRLHLFIPAGAGDAAGNKGPFPVIVRGDLVFDRARRRVSRAGRPLSLTRKEMGILEELLVADGSVVSTEDLLERVWDENADPFTRTVTVTIARLRSKLGEPDPIETVVGSGYRLP